MDGRRRRDRHEPRPRHARAILEKNLKLNQEGATSFDTGAYAGEAGRKNWIERKESQIAGNKFTGTLGPIRAPQFVKNTARFDYQPDLCKDYKDTGFCGYGDNCKFLHDRGDYKTGWQLEQEWESTQRRKQERAMLAAPGADGELPDDDDDEREANRYKVRGAADDDTLPFACHLCRGPFRDPIVTPCQHYFCANCALSRHRAGESSCAICGKQTSGLFNQATKLNAHARRSGGFQALFEQRFTGRRGADRRAARRRRRGRAHVRGRGAGRGGVPWRVGGGAELAPSAGVAARCRGAGGPRGRIGRSYAPEAARTPGNDPFLTGTSVPLYAGSLLGLSLRGFYPPSGGVSAVRGSRARDLAESRALRSRRRLLVQKDHDDVASAFGDRLCCVSYLAALEDNHRSGSLLASRDTKFAALPLAHHEIAPLKRASHPEEDAQVAAVGVPVAPIACVRDVLANGEALGSILALAETERRPTSPSGASRRSPQSTTCADPARHGSAQTATVSASSLPRCGCRSVVTVEPTRNLCGGGNRPTTRRVKLERNPHRRGRLTSYEGGTC